MCVSQQSVDSTHIHGGQLKIKRTCKNNNNKTNERATGGMCDVSPALRSTLTEAVDGGGGENDVVSSGSDDRP